MYYRKHLLLCIESTMGCLDKLQAMKKQMEMEKAKKRRRRSVKKGKAYESTTPGAIITGAASSTPATPPPPPPPPHISQQQPMVSSSSSPAFFVFETQYSILTIDWVSVGLDPAAYFAPRLRFFEPSYNAYLVLDKESWTEFIKLEQEIMYNFTCSDIVSQFPSIQTKSGTYSIQFECLFGEKFLCLECIKNDNNNNNNNNSNNASTVKKYFKFEVISELFKMKNMLSYRMRFLENLNFEKHYFGILQIIVNLRAQGNNNSSSNSEDLRHYISLLIDAYTNADLPETPLAICFLETAHFLNNDKVMYDITNMQFFEELFSLCKN